MIEEVGLTYFVLIVMLFLCVGFDIFNYIVVFIAKQTDYKQYCTYGIKYIKLIMYFIFGVLMFIFGFTTDLSVFSRNVHIVIGSLLVADFIYGLAIKIKFGKKRSQR